MLTIEIPGRRTLNLKHLVLDVNGTLALDGSVIDGVAAHLQGLSRQLEIHLLTADTHGRQKEIDLILGIKGDIIPAGKEKEAKAHYIEELGAESVVAIGNGSNDAHMLKKAGIGIAVLGPEGLSTEALNGADVVSDSIAAALDLLLHPNRLITTLRR